MSIMAAISGTSGNDHIKGTKTADILHGLAGNDHVKGRNGNDDIFGDAGNDSLYGNAGKDDLYGGTGNDRIWGGSGNDAVFGEGGNDWIWGGKGNDVLKGGSGNDRIHGGDGNDTLNGNAGSNSLFGGRGDDVLAADISEMLAAKANGGTNSFDGGHGSDTLSITNAEPNFVALALDDRFGRKGLDLDFNADNGPDSMVTNIENVIVHQVTTNFIPASIIIDGTEANNRVEIVGGFAAVRTYGGNDTIKVTENVVTTDFNLYPGEGNDHVSVISGNSHIIDYSDQSPNSPGFADSTSGSDVYSLGSGRDEISYSTPSTTSPFYVPGSYVGTDTIIGFEKNVDNIFFVGETEGTSANPEDFTITENAGKTVFTYAGGGSVTVDAVGLVLGNAHGGLEGDYFFL
jgi:hypothetical protein